MYRGEGQPAVLLRPYKGKAVRVDNEDPFERSLEDTFYSPMDTSHELLLLSMEDSQDLP